MSWTEIQGQATFGFTIVGLIVVFGPLVAEKVRLPGLLGLLIGGALIGPNMLNVLPDFTALESIGNIGVLYLIFLAGLQLDIEAFVRNRKTSLGFGLLTAFIPLILGTLAALALGLEFSAAVLTGSFWASFTLITYPTLSKYGLTRNPAVAATIGASAITDTISLIILALVIGAETGDQATPRLVVSIALGMALLAIWCFVVVPAVARWFFAGLGEERTVRYMFVLISLTSSAVVADIVEIEPLIGAFFVGVGLNRVVPNRSPLMSMTDFFGNAFFIPTFLVSVGLLFNPEVMFAWATIRLAIGFGVALIVGKLLAAWLSGRTFGLDRAEVGVMASVSVAQAAATLAATIIGLEAGLYGDDVVNAVMVVVGVSLILTSIGTDRFAPMVSPPAEERRRVGEAILIPADSEPEVLEMVVNLAATFTQPVSGVLQPIIVATSTEDTALELVSESRASADRILRRAGRDVECRVRIDRSISSGINQAAIEWDSSLLILAWPGPTSARQWLLGASYREIITATSLPIIVAGLQAPQPPADARLFLLVVEEDLLPGNQPSLRLGIDIASTLANGAPVTVGPLHPDQIMEAGITLPADVVHQAGDGHVANFAREVSKPGDTIVIPMPDDELRRTLLDLYEDGRTMLATAHNPESQSPVSGGTIALHSKGAM